MLLMILCKKLKEKLMTPKCQSLNSEKLSKIDMESSSEMPFTINLWHFLILIETNKFT